MKTIKLYWENTYLFNHQAVITKIAEDAIGTYVQLDETIFHPKGGGQPEDAGTIAGLPVLRLVEENEEIKHYIDPKAGVSFELGQRVKLSIDAVRRTENAALHSMGHIMHGILQKHYGLGVQTACNHFPQQASVTYKANGKSMPKGESFRAEIQSVIENNTPLRICTIEGERRLEVEGYEPVRCGGTHISNASELKDFAIRGIKHDKKSDTFKISYSVKHLGYEKLLAPRELFKPPVVEEKAEQALVEDQKPKEPQQLVVVEESANSMGLG